MIFTKADIPADIDTYEKLAVWLGTLMEQVCGTREAIEVEGARSEKVAQCPIFVTPSNELRVTVRLSVPMDRAVYSDRTKKFWQFALPVADTNVPASFKVA
jgi:hypothetical protein